MRKVVFGLVAIMLLAFASGAPAMVAPVEISPMWTPAATGAATIKFDKEMMDSLYLYDFDGNGAGDYLKVADGAAFKRGVKSWTLFFDFVGSSFKAYSSLDLDNKLDLGSTNTFGLAFLVGNTYEKAFTLENNGDAYNWLVSKGESVYGISGATATPIPAALWLLGSGLLSLLGVRRFAAKS